MLATRKRANTRRRVQLVFAGQPMLGGPPYRREFATTARQKQLAFFKQLNT